MVWPFRRRERVNPMDPQRLLADAQAVNQAVNVPAGPFRFEVEDVFVIIGRGVVATGRIASGRIAVGQVVTIERSGAVMAEWEVGGIEKFRATTDSAVAGENVGLLFGSIGKDDLQRGDILR